MTLVDDDRSQRELTAGLGSFVIRQQRVVSDPRREDAFGQSHDGYQVEVETHSHADGADEDPFAHSPHPPQVSFELELEGAGHDIQGNRALDFPQARQSFQRPVHALDGPLLDDRPLGPASPTQDPVRMAGHTVPPPSRWAWRRRSSRR